MIVQRDITISSPNLNQNISQSELYLNHNHRHQPQLHSNQYISNPDVYNKIIGFNGPTQGMCSNSVENWPRFYSCGAIKTQNKGLPTYEEHLMINGSKSSLHHLAGSNQRINRGYHQPGIISRSKQSLNEFYQPPPPTQARSSLTNDDLLVSKPIYKHFFFAKIHQNDFRHHHPGPSTTI